MSHVVKNERVLSAVLDFTDGDDRTLTIDAPNTSLDLATQVDSLGAYIKDHQILLGDKTGAECKGFKSAKLVNQKTTYLDITPNA